MVRKNGQMEGTKVTVGLATKFYIYIVLCSTIHIYFSTIAYKIFSIQKYKMNDKKHMILIQENFLEYSIK